MKPKNSDTDEEIGLDAIEIAFPNGVFPRKARKVNPEQEVLWIGKPGLDDKSVI